MDTYNDRTLHGVQFVRDGVDGNPAYKTNGAREANLLGYASPSETAVDAMTVPSEVGPVTFQTGPKTYNSAIAVEWWASREDRQNPMFQVTIDDAFKDALRLFYGQRVASEAEDPDSGLHPFFRAVLAAKTGSVLEITWRNRA